MYLPATGAYTIVIDGQDDATGNYMIALNRLDGDAGTLAYGGQSISREISPAGDQDEFIFADAAGHRVTAFLDNVVSSPSPRLSLRLTKSDGITLAYCDFADLPCRMGSIFLPDTGIYTLTVDGEYDAVGSYTLSLSSTTAVQENADDLPRWFELRQNHPNPFNPSTRIYFQLPKPSQVTIRIFDINGRWIHTLVDRKLEAGRFEEIWEGRKNDGTPVKSGEYFLLMQTAEFRDVKKLLLIR